MSDKFSLSIKELDGKNVTQIALVGDFDSSSKEEVQQIEDKVNQAGEAHHFLFDLSGLRFLNSYAIGQLVGWHNELEPKKGRILIVGANPNVGEIFSILGITNLFELYPDQASALQNLT